MIPSALCALVVALSSLAAANGAVVQRDGTFTYLSPQPTLQGTPTTSSTPATLPTTSATTSMVTSVTSTQSTSTALTVSSTIQTSPIPTTSATISPVVSTTTASTIPTTSATIPPVVSTTTASTIPTTSATIPPVVSTTPTSTIPTTSATIPPAVSSTQTVTATPSPTSTSAPGTVNCNNFQKWQAAFAYTAGNQVIFNGQLYTARQWTFNNAPSMHPDQWTLVGTCTQPINNQVSCSGVSAWQSTVAYTSGNRVTFNGRLWSAVQWTESNTPGDASGTWQDLGICA